MKKLIHVFNWSYLNLIWIFVALLIGTGPALLNYVADPYEVFRGGVIGKNAAELAEKSHYPLWKMTHYPGDSSIVVLGDSRARALRDKYWHELGLTGAYNFAYGGGTIPEIYSTFQQIKNNSKLKTLVVGIQLRSFDLKHKGGMNRVPEAVKVSGSALNYLKNWSVSKTSLRVILGENPHFQALSHAIGNLLTLSAQATDFGQPGAFAVDELLKPEICFGCELPEDGAFYVPVSRASKGVNLGLGRGSAWREHPYGFVIGSRAIPAKYERQVTKNAKADWKNFQFSEQYFDMIRELADWANSDPERHLVFVVPPTIPEMQATINMFGLGKLNRELRARLSAHAPVVDLDFPNEVTADLENFSDAYHFNARIARSIVGELALMLPDSSDAVKAKAKKRRSVIRCPSQAYNFDSNPLPMGQSDDSAACRIWKGNNHG